MISGVGSHPLHPPLELCPAQPCGGETGSQVGAAAWSRCQAQVAHCGARCEETHPLSAVRQSLFTLRPSHCDYSEARAIHTRCCDCSEARPIHTRCCDCSEARPIHTRCCDCSEARPIHTRCCDCSEARPIHTRCCDCSESGLIHTMFHTIVTAASLGPVHTA